MHFTYFCIVNPHIPLVKTSYYPPIWVSLIPVLLLLGALLTLIIAIGAGLVQDYSCYILLAAAAVSIILSRIFTKRSWRVIWLGLCKSARQIIPAVPILLFIGTLSSTWMLSGVVPMLIDYGLRILDPGMFLVTTCAICAAVSVVTGSSWTTIATIGVALMGIGTVMGYSEVWVAGAIISGAYFGDKVSPLSDTTVLAASSTGVELLTHIRFMMITTIPAITVAFIVYALSGMESNAYYAEHTAEMLRALDSTFVITPWLLAVPVLTCVMIAMRLNTALTLALSSMLALVAIFVFQPQVVAVLSGGDFSFVALTRMAFQMLLSETTLSTGNDLFDSLVSTNGMLGMMPTVYLVLSAMVFGGAMIGTGMLSVITRSFTKKLNSSRNLVSATVGSGLFLNSCTGDQYLSIIIGGNVYKSTYRRNKMKPQVLSRALEDSISVTSVLIPWNSCGVTQSTVLGVATIAYLPFCVFNYVSPLMSVVIAWIGWRIYAVPGANSRLAVSG